MKIFEYAIVYIPNEESKEAGKRSAILVQPQVVLANNEREVTFKAAKQIPVEYEEALDQIQVAVRPF